MKHPALFLFFAMLLPWSTATDQEEDTTTITTITTITNTTAQTALDDLDDLNDIDDDDSAPFNATAKEVLIRQAIAESVRNRDTKMKIARILPILRMMNSEQRLAMASLVSAQVLQPQESRGLTLDQVHDLFGGNPNMTSELLLPISLDIANVFRSARAENLPTAEELRVPPSWRRRAQHPPHRAAPPGQRRPPQPPKMAETSSDGDCELFTNSICLKSDDYPTDAIMSTIRRNKQAMAALLADVRDVPMELKIDGVTSKQEVKHTIEQTPHAFISNRRNSNDPGFMCPSQINYARPQKARNTNGQWKYIVNTLEHTQTLRLERCMKPKEPCTYLTENYKSTCLQVYNYHRLLTWDKTNGLHMDIFKVPSCCSCHIDGYQVAYPPSFDHTPVHEEDFPGEEIAGEDHSHHHQHHVPLPDTDHIHNLVGSSGGGIRLPNHKPPSLDNLEASQSKPHNYFHDIGPTTASDAGDLSKYLQAPRPQPNSITGGKHGNKRLPNQGKGRPPPNKIRGGRPHNRPRFRKPVYIDQSLGESAVVEERYQTTEQTTNQKLPPKPQQQQNIGIGMENRRVNYNYHPIIDFFAPEKAEKRMDAGESEWKPMTTADLRNHRYEKR